MAGLAANQIDQAVALLREQLAPQLIYYFGSAARGELRPDSDLDFAFLADREFGSYEVFMVAQQLAEVLRRDVDLIDLVKVSTVMQAQIISSGKNIYASAPNLRIDFEIRILKDYTLLNEERQVIIDSFVKEMKRNGQ